MVEGCCNGFILAGDDVVVVLFCRGGCCCDGFILAGEQLSVLLRDQLHQAALEHHSLDDVMVGGCCGSFILAGDDAVVVLIWQGMMLL